MGVTCGASAVCSSTVVTVTLRATTLLLLAPWALLLAGCNPEDDGPTVCDDHTTPVLALDPGGQPIPVDGGIVDPTQCQQACEAGSPSSCGVALLEAGVFMTCIQDAGVDCHR